MKYKAILILLSVIYMSLACSADNTAKVGRFNVEKDILLVQLDCKTDVDDIHTAAALATMMYNSEFSKINYHVVTGTYGIQGGEYVPPNSLLELAFENNWTDAHENFDDALKQTKVLVKTTLENGGDIWIAEAGQSDFSAELIKAIQSDLNDINTTQRIHIVQHSDWNEENTSPINLAFVKENADYNRIPDGNAIGNGSPGFLSHEYTEWRSKIKDPKLLEIWQHSIDLANKYNGEDGRYNNPAIADGGLDFSDLAEVCWIFGLEDIKDVEHFFNLYSN
jgi:hypothetical protein